MFKRGIKRAHKMRERSERMTLYIAFPILLLWSFTLIYPFLWALINSFKTPIDYFDNSFALPKEWQFKNWSQAFTFLQVPKSDPFAPKAGFWELVFNSCWYVFGNAFITLFVCSALSYALAKYQNKWTGFLFKLSLVVMMIPIIGAMPARYKLLHDLGLAESPLYLVTAIGCIGSSTLLILHSFYKGISWTYAEAVFIDGGGHWTVYSKIMVPQAVPILIALFITNCITLWNDYLNPLTYLGDYPTLATGLYIVERGSLTANNKPLYFAVMLISVIPIFSLFCAFSDTIMSNVSIGGIKG